MTWTVFLLVLASAGVFAWALATRSDGSGSSGADSGGAGPVPPPPAVGTWEHILWRKKEDLDHYRRAMDLKFAGDSAAFQAAVERTLERFGETFRLADELLDPVRDPDGSIPSDYLGYVADLAPLKVRMSDLAREVSFELSDASDEPADH